MMTGIPRWALIADQRNPEWYYVSECSECDTLCLKFPLARAQGELAVTLLNANPAWSVNFKRWCDGQDNDAMLAEIMAWFIREGIFTA